MQRSVNVDLYRNRLLERLAIAADNPVKTFDSLEENTVDTVVSMALAEVEERAEDSLSVVLLCIGILAADGQFARLSLLADRLISLSRRADAKRPYLSTAAEAFALILKSREVQAGQYLQERLGLTKDIEPIRVAGSREQLEDILMAAALRNLLIDDNQDFAQRVAEAAIQDQAGLLFTFVEAMLHWYDAARTARPRQVLAQADSTFLDSKLQHYLARRRINVLYPSQIKAIQGGATLDVNRVVSLPTSSGKTLIAEFRIAAALSRHPGSRAIYVAPYRMLARQVERSFRDGLAPLGIKVKDLGSGFDLSFYPDESGLPDVAICTPERIDALLRLSSINDPSGIQAAELLTSTNVIVFDELQLVGRPGRGPRFELILTRLRAKYPNILFLGLSAASQGADDVAQWLTQTNAIAGASRPTGTLEIIWETDGTLRQRVEPRPTTVGKLPRSKALDDAAKLIVRLDHRYRPALAVETSRQWAESLAQKVTQLSPVVASQWRDSLKTAELDRLNSAIEETRKLLGEDHPLALYMESGVAFHHAGVPTHVLQQVENLAERRLLRVVCATTTVAEGADLPFRVVVLPHLNFPGAARRLDRDLYLNIIGRAGRVNVSVEGLVFILNSDAATLKDVVRSSLWRNTTADRIRGRLGEVDTTLRDMEDWTAYYDVQSQVMGWLGDGSSYVEDQAQQLATTSLSWHQAATPRDREVVVGLIADALDDLRDRGYALAASPYRLTTRGHSARLTGLSAPTINRLERAIERGRAGWLRDLVGIEVITADIATQLARLVYESVEVAEKGLWIRKVGSSEQAKFEALVRFADGNDGFRESEAYQAEVQLFSYWITGASFVELARAAPVYDNKNSLFGGKDEPKRTSDATEHIGRLTYPASWAWSGARVLAGGLGDAFPGFIRSAIELGLPSEGATQLVALAQLTRPAALAVTKITGPKWSVVVEWISSFEGSLPDLGLTRLDAGRLAALKERLKSADGA
jgi:superfamily II DNA/RNA helicase